MTCKEKLLQIYPQQVHPDYTGGCFGCPNIYDAMKYIPKPDYCKRIKHHAECTECWNREIPEEKEKENKPMKKTKAMLEEELDQKRAEIEELKKELVKAEKYKRYDDAAGEMKAMHDSFVNAGFNEDQAFTILMTMLQNQKAASNSWDSYLAKYLSMHRK